MYRYVLTEWKWICRGFWLLVYICINVENSIIKRVAIIGLTPPHLCDCPQPRLPTPFAVVFLWLSYVKTSNNIRCGHFVIVQSQDFQHHSLWSFCDCPEPRLPTPFVVDFLWLSWAKTSNAIRCGLFVFNDLKWEMLSIGHYF